MRMNLNNPDSPQATPFTPILPMIAAPPQPVVAAPPRPTVARLSTLEAGATGRVVQVIATSEDILRLQALGVCIGRRIELVKAGDPMIINVVGARVGLSARLAAEVRVEIDSQSSRTIPLANAS